MGDLGYPPHGLETFKWRIMGCWPAPMWFQRLSNTEKRSSETRTGTDQSSDSPGMSQPRFSVKISLLALWIQVNPGDTRVNIHILRTGKSPFYSWLNPLSITIFNSKLWMFTRGYFRHQPHSEKGALIPALVLAIHHPTRLVRQRYWCGSPLCWSMLPGLVNIHS